MEKIMNSVISVVKRSGDKEVLDINKLHVMVEAACEDLSGVSASQVEMNSNIQFYDGITTDAIQEILIKSASDLIDLDHPNSSSKGITNTPTEDRKAAEVRSTMKVTAATNHAR